MLHHERLDDARIARIEAALAQCAWRQIESCGLAGVTRQAAAARETWACQLPAA